VPRHFPPASSQTWSLLICPVVRLLSRPNQPIDYVYFPQEGMVSPMLQLDEASVIKARLG
jgi:hypothetical protein